jgi:hypothetical protein
MTNNTGSLDHVDPRPAWRGLGDAKLALDREIAGPLEAASAYMMKQPPRQMRDTDARKALARIIDGERRHDRTPLNGGRGMRS